MPSNTEALAACEKRAREQRGVLSQAEAQEEGLPYRAIRRLVSSGRWTEVFPRALLPQPVPLEWETMLKAATVSVEGAVAAGGAVLRLLGFERYFRAELEIASLRGVRLADVICRRYRRPDVLAPVTIRGIPTRALPLVLLDMCADLDRYEAARLIDEALRRKLVTLAQLQNALILIGGRGKGGTRLFRQLILERDDSDALTDSELERIFKNFAARSGLRPSAHYKVFDETGGFVCEADFAFVEAKVAIQLDGFKWHTSRSQFEKDRRQDVIMTRLGWKVLRFTWYQLRFEREWVFEQISLALA